MERDGVGMLLRRKEKERKKGSETPGPHRLGDHTDPPPGGPSSNSAACSKKHHPFWGSWHPSLSVASAWPSPRPRLHLSPPCNILRMSFSNPKGSRTGCVSRAQPAWLPLDAAPASR